MIKYSITKNGLIQNVKYKRNNSNRVGIQEKILAVLSNGLGYTSSSLYGCIQADGAIDRKYLGEATVQKTLDDMVNSGLVQFVDTDNMGGEI